MIGDKFLRISNGKSIRKILRRLYEVCNVYLNLGPVESPHPNHGCIFYLSNWHLHRWESDSHNNVSCRRPHYFQPLFVPYLSAATWRFGSEICRVFVMRFSWQRAKINLLRLKMNFFGRNFTYDFVLEERKIHYYTHLRAITTQAERQNTEDNDWEQNWMQILWPCTRTANKWFPLKFAQQNKTKMEFKMSN